MVKADALPSPINMKLVEGTLIYQSQYFFKLSHCNVHLFICLSSCCIFHGSSFIGYISSFFSGKSVMTKSQQKREKGQKREKTKKRKEFKRKWTTDEDNILINFKAEHPDLRWKEIIKQGKLKGKNEKSCSHRWNNYLRSGIVKGGFTPQEDLIIIQQMSLPHNRY